MNLFAEEISKSSGNINSLVQKIQVEQEGYIKVREDEVRQKEKELKEKSRQLAERRT